jgi:dihydroneopterin aldolase
VTDRIVLAGIEVFAYHGVFEEEQAEGQLFGVDVEIETDMSAAAASDDLADTIDYGLLADRVHQRVAEERWNLIEKVADRVADLVLEDPRVTAVSVTIHKPQAPIAVPFRDVTVVRRRSR